MRREERRNLSGNHFVRVLRRRNERQNARVVRLHEQRHAVVHPQRDHHNQRDGRNESSLRFTKVSGSTFNVDRGSARTPTPMHVLIRLPVVYGLTAFNKNDLGKGGRHRRWSTVLNCVLDRKEGCNKHTIYRCSFREVAAGAGAAPSAGSPASLDRLGSGLSGIASAPSSSGTTLG